MVSLWIVSLFRNWWRYDEYCIEEKSAARRFCAERTCVSFLSPRILESDPRDALFCVKKKSSKNSPRSVRFVSSSFGFTHFPSSLLKILVSSFLLMSSRLLIISFRSHSFIIISSCFPLRLTCLSISHDLDLSSSLLPNWSWYTQ